MMLPEAVLKRLERQQTMSVNSAIAKKIIPDDREHLNGYRSLAEMLNAQAAEKTKMTKKELRERRRELQLQEQQKRSNNTETQHTEPDSKDVTDGTRTENRDGVS